MSKGQNLEGLRVQKQQTPRMVQTKIFTTKYISNLRNEKWRFSFSQIRTQLDSMHLRLNFLPFVMNHNNDVLDLFLQSIRHDPHGWVVFNSIDVAG